MSKAVVEVQLVARDEERIKNWSNMTEVEEYAFTASVTGCKEWEDGTDFLVLYYQDGGHVVRDVNVAEFFILSMTYTPSDFTDHSVQDIYGLHDQEQSDAFDMAKEWLEKEGVQQPEIILLGGQEEVSSNSGGPKRLEVELKNRSGRTRKIVLTDALSPDGTWDNHSLSGREWTSVGGDRLGDLQVSLHAPEWRIRRIDKILGEKDARSTTHYNESPESQKNAWEILLEAWAKFTEPEKLTLRNWKPLDGVGDAHANRIFGAYGRGGNQHWTNRPPNAYTPTPIVAHWRIKGDEVGAELYRGQVEALGEPMDMDEVLAFMEKKDEAEEEGETSAEEEPNNNDDGDAAGDAVSSDADYSLCHCGLDEECDSPICFGIKFGQDAGYTTH